MLNKLLRVGRNANYRKNQLCVFLHMCKQFINTDVFPCKFEKNVRNFLKDSECQKYQAFQGWRLIPRGGYNIKDFSDWLLSL